jgi:protein transport protein SEC39
MARVSDLSGAQSIILATQLSADNNLETLQQLQLHHPNILNGILVLRILLTFLPESIEPTSYTPFLSDLAASSGSLNSDIRVDTTSVRDVPEATARQRVRKLRLLPLEYTPSNPISADSPSLDAVKADPLTSFLIHRAYRIDAETGLLPLVLQLVEPFIEHSEYLRTWLMSSLLPLLRLNYEYYLENNAVWSLEAFQAVDANSGLALLLPEGKADMERPIGRDLRGLVGPWIYGKNRSKRRKVGDTKSEEEIGLALPRGTLPQWTPTWEHVNRWIVQSSKKDFNLAVKIFETWRGPHDIDLGGYEDEADTATLTEDDERENNDYAQAALRCIVCTQEHSRAVNDGSYRLLVRAAEVAKLDKPPDLPDSFDTLPKVMDRPTSSGPGLQDETLPFKPTEEIIKFLYGIIFSCRVLLDMEFPLSCQTAAKLSYDLDSQTLELKKLLEHVAKKSKPARVWFEVRAQLHWLRDWEDRLRNGDMDLDRPGFGIFGHVDKTNLDEEILKAVLAAGGMLPLQGDWIVANVCRLQCSS